MVDKPEFKEETDTKPKLVTSDDAAHVESPDAVANELEAGNSQEVARAGEPHAATNEAGKIPGKMSEFQGNQQPALSGGDAIDEDQVRERCLADLRAPLKEITTRATASMIEHSEETNAAMGLGIAPILLIITAIVVGTLGVRRYGHSIHTADLRSLMGILLPEIWMMLQTRVACVTTDR